MDINSINWYPGHMAKTKRLISDSLKSVDIVLEIIDARIPCSSRNPDIDDLVSSKPRLLLLNKTDLADPEATKLWLNYYNNLGISALGITCTTGSSATAILSKIRSILSDKLERLKQRSIEGKSIKIMMIGVPNAGKSSLINLLAGGRRTKVEDRPGVTRGKQWVTLKEGFDLLDMPGILPPKLADAKTGINLSVTGAIKDTINDTEGLAAYLALWLYQNKRDLLTKRYPIKELSAENGYDVLEAIGRRRGFLISGGDIDIERTANVFLDEFRGGKIGRITLELPETLC